MKLGHKALLLPAGLLAGLVFEGFALSFSAALPSTGCVPAAATDAGPVGPNTSVCCGGGGTCISGAPSCCVPAGSACDQDYDCCTGSCSSGQCVANANTKCKDALGSRCNAGQCACASDDDCCIGSCNASTVATAGNGDGGDGQRCCLAGGLPCSSSYDCCSGGCRADTLQCQ